MLVNPYYQYRYMYPDGQKNTEQLIKLITRAYRAAGFERIPLPQSKRNYFNSQNDELLSFVPQSKWRTTVPAKLRIKRMLDDWFSRAAAKRYAPGGDGYELAKKSFESHSIPKKTRKRVENKRVSSQVPTTRVSEILKAINRETAKNPATKRSRKDTSITLKN